MRSPSIRNLLECFRRGGLALVFIFALAPAAALAQSQITTGTVQGTIEDETGAVVPGVAVEARNVETGLAPLADDRRRRALRLPATRARSLHGHGHEVGLRHRRAGGVPAHGRPDRLARPADEGLGRGGESHRQRLGHRHRGHDEDRGEHDHQPPLGREPAGARQEVRRPADPDARRLRRAGAGRRRDQLRRPARRLQQHQPRRRRLQQRLLRRAGRRPARRD